MGATWLIRLVLISSFCSMRQLRVFLLPLDGMLVNHRGVTLQQQICQYPFTHLGGERHCES